MQPGQIGYEAPAHFNGSSRGTADFQIDTADPAQDRGQDVLGHGQEVVDGGDHAHVKGPRDDPKLEAPAARPVRQRKPNVRYQATEFDLNSDRMRSRRTISRAI